MVIKKELLFICFWVGDDFAIHHPGVKNVLKYQKKISKKKNSQGVTQTTEVVH